MIHVFVAISLILLLVLGYPVGIALILAGVFGLILIGDIQVTGALLGSIPYTSVARYALITVPLFIAMGMMARHARIAEGTFWLLRKPLARVPGGVGLTSLGAMAAFSAVSGSSAAAVASIGPIADEEMTKSGYSGALRGGIIAASGTLGVLIPPSIILVVYGIITQTNIGALLMAGVVPGLLSVLIYGALVMVLASRGLSGVTTSVAVADDDVSATPIETRYRAPSLVAAIARWAPLFKISLLFTIVIGGIYTGLFTATEAAAVGAFATFVILLFQRDTWEQRLQPIRVALRDTTALTSMIFLLLVGASIFSMYLVRSRAPHNLAAAIGSWQVHPMAIVFGFIMVLIVLGMFLDSLSMLVIVVPLMHPIVSGDLGYDAIWVAILVVKSIEIGLITPPVGLNVYVVSGSVPSLPVATVFKGVAPFLLADLLTIGLIAAYPIIVTWLPSLRTGAG